MRGRSRRLRLLALLAVASLTLTGVGARPAEAENLEQKMQQLQKTQQQLKEQMGATQAELGALEEKAKQAEQEYQQAAAAAEEAQARVVELNRQRTAAEARLESVTRELRRVEANLNRQKAALAARLRALYIDGRVNYLEVLFSAASFSDFLTRFELLQSVVRQDAQLVAGLREARRAVAAKRAEAQAVRDQLAAMEAEARRQKEQADLKVAEAQQKRQQMDATKRELLAALEALEAENRAVEKQILEVQQQLARQRTGGLGMRYPVDQVIVTDDYGMRWHPILGDYRMHWGVDFAADYGANVYAAESGTVIAAGWQGAYGNAVIIYHGDVAGRGGVSTLYGHNSQVLVKPGQEVQKGQVIAKAGATGWATGPHVHFEVRVNGKPVNPWDFLPKR